MGLVANGQGEPSISGLMDEAVEKVHSSLQELAAGPDLAEKLTEAFGEKGSKKAVEEVTPDWLTGNFSGLPELKVVSSAEIDGANGAYAEATDTIYISGEFLVENIGSPQAVADVLLEEIGHHVDARINVFDTEGDEGDLFSAVVQGKELGQPQIEILRGEDDTAIVVIDGETLKIEKDDSFEAAWDLGTLNGTNGLNDYFSNGDANDYSRFYLPNTSNVNITLSGLSEDIDVQLLRDDGSFVDQSILGGDSDELISQVLDAGTYYVRVYPAFGSANSNYSLSLSADSLSGTTETQTNSSDEWVSYTVQSGDSLSQIALNTTGDANRYWDIADYNGIDDPNSIYVGQQIQIPENNSTGTTVEVTTENNDEWEWYTVQSGDSLWDIAQRATGDGNRYWDIADYNGIDDPNSIYVGQQIQIPENNSTGTTVEVTTGDDSGNYIENDTYFTLTIPAYDDWSDNYSQRAEEGYGIFSDSWAIPRWDIYYSAQGLAQTWDWEGKDDAAEFLRHYLSNTGTTFEFDLSEAERESEGIRNALEEGRNDVIAHAKNSVWNGDTAGRIERGAQGYNLIPWGYATDNWQLSLGKFDHFHDGDFWVEGNNLYVQITSTVKDVYDFEDLNPIDLLHGQEIAKNFPVVGTITETFVEPLDF
jgi:nucleoid-associated protein YgaU